MLRNRERGAIRPLWLMIGAITCVATGSVVNKCLCDPTSETANVAVVVKGDLIAEIPTPPVVEPGDTPPKFADTDPGMVDKTVPIDPPKPTPEDPKDQVDPVKDESARIPMPDPEVVKDPKLKPLLDDADKTPIKKGYKELTFEFISNWTYVFPEIEEGKPPRPDPTPKAHKDLNGKKFAVRGFMIPFKVDGEDVTEFLLVRNQFACCFGVVPKMNEWIHVKMAKGTVAPYAVDIPITVYGKLDCGELIEKGVVMSLYRMEATEVTEPPVFR